MPEPKQSDMFDDEQPAFAPAPHATARAAVLRVDLPAAGLSKEQAQFNKLSASVAGLQAHLGSLDASATRLKSWVTENLHPVVEAVNTSRRAALLEMDALLLQPAGAGPKLSKRRRKVLEGFLADCCASLLDDDPNDEELLAVHDRYAAFTRAEDEEMDVAIAQEMMGKLFGKEVFEGAEDAKSMDELMGHAAQKLAQQQAEQEEQREQRRQKRSAGKAKPPTAAERAALESGTAVRELYRKLASSLHPDREPDEAERQRKTALMQRANQAYERNDLLALLNMQSELEMLDAQHLAQASKERMAAYCRLLKEQEQALKQQVGEISQEVLGLLGLDPWISLPPEAHWPRYGERRVKEFRQMLRQVQEDMAALRDPARRHAAIDQIERLQRDESDGLDDDFDPFDDGMLAAALSQFQPPRPAGTHRGGGKPKPPKRKGGKP